MAGNERFTEFEVLYELVDVDAASDASYSAQNIKSFSKLPLLNEMVPFTDYITLEHNYSIMDGTMPEFPDTPPTNIPFFSSKTSGMTGRWSDTKRPTLDIRFDDVHSSYALTLYLLNTDIKKAKVTWYQNNVILTQAECTIDDLGIIHQGVEEYNRILIEFSESVPDRYVKLYGIYYGVKLVWDETVIKSGNMTKDIDIISEKLPSDSLNFEIIDVNFGDLNLGNPDGIHNYFQKNQPLYAYEWLNENKLPIGKFFLKEYLHESNVGRLNCVSYIDIMEDIPFNLGKLYYGVKAGKLLEQIFEVVGIEHYQIDPGTYNQLLYGTLKPDSCREALRQVLFACQSIIDTSNPDKVYVQKLSTTIAGTVKRSTKFNTAVRRSDYISGVKLTYPVFKKLDEVTPITEDTLYEKGEHIIVFDGPYDDVQFSSKYAIYNIEIGTYFVKFTAGQDVTISLTGKGYIETTNSVQRTRKLEAGKFENIKEFDTTLCNYTTAKELAQLLLSYFSLDMEVTIKALATDVDIEHRYIVENNNPKYNDYVGVYSQRTFDLVGGFIQDSTLSMTFLTDANKIYFDREAGLEEIFLDQEDTAII